jgi:hypothetical protein
LVCASFACGDLALNKLDGAAAPRPGSGLFPDLENIHFFNSPLKE